MFDKSRFNPMDVRFKSHVNSLFKVSESLRKCKRSVTMLKHPLQLQKPHIVRSCNFEMIEIAFGTKHQCPYTQFQYFATLNFAGAWVKSAAKTELTIPWSLISHGQFERTAQSKSCRIRKIQYMIHNTQYTIYNIQYTPHKGTQYTLENAIQYNTQYTMNNTQYTIHNQINNTNNTQDSTQYNTQHNTQDTINNT